MDLRELMQYAPEDCRPTVITKESRLAVYAKRIGKTVDELTEEDKKAEQEDYNQTCWSSYDLMSS